MLVFDRKNSIYSNILTVVLHKNFEGLKNPFMILYLILLDMISLSLHCIWATGGHKNNLPLTMKKVFQAKPKNQIYKNFNCKNLEEVSFYFRGNYKIFILFKIRPFLKSIKILLVIALLCMRWKLGGGIQKKVLFQFDSVDYFYVFIIH